MPRWTQTLKNSVAYKPVGGLRNTPNAQNALMDQTLKPFSSNRFGGAGNAHNAQVDCGLNSPGGLSQCPECPDGPKLYVA